MELTRQSVRYYDVALETGVSKGESADMIVPDLYPDILRIVDATGLAVVKERRLSDGRAEIQGAVRVTILYVPEGDKGFKKMELTIPYTHSFETPSLSGEAELQCRVHLLNVDAHPINPRKLQVAVAVQVDITVYDVHTLELASGVTDPDNEAKLETLTDTIEAWLPTAVKTRPLQISDEMEISGPPVAEILRADVRLVARDIKPIGNKAVLKGSALVKLLYATTPMVSEPEEVCSASSEIPFSQILELDGLDEHSELNVQLLLSSVDLDVRALMSGEARVIAVTLGLDAQMVAAGEYKLDALCDLYSTHYEITPELFPATTPALVAQTTHHQALRGMLDMGMPVRHVVDTGVTLLPAQWKREDGRLALWSDAVIKVLFVDDTGSFHTAARRVGVDAAIEAETGSTVSVRAALSDDMSTALSTDGAEVRFGVDFSVTLTTKNSRMTVTGLNGDTSTPRETEREPSVVLRRKTPGENLWEIAKKYRTTRDHIRAANTKLDEGDDMLLLIPRKR